MESDPLTIIIPAFNEGENIGLVLSTLEKRKSLNLKSIKSIQFFSFI